MFVEEKEKQHISLNGNLRKMNKIELPILYKRSVQNKISTWQVIVENNTFYTISGYIDGLKVQSQPTECEPKNNGKKNSTTADEQAMAEAQAMHRKRIELGSFENINDIDKPVYFSPMLAQEYSKVKPNVPLFSDEKLDGVRCIIKADGMWSRNGKPIVSAPHIFNSLKFLFDSNEDLILDGELYADKSKADFNTIISCVRKSKPNDFDLMVSEEYIQYHIYDCPSHNDVFSKRKKYLHSLPLPNNCIVLNSILCYTHEEIDSLYKTYLEKGYEGQMLRTDSLYENKRSKNLIKRKEFHDDEFVIIDVIEGLGNMKNKVGKFRFKTKENVEFDASVNATWEESEKLWKNRHSLIGQKATVKYFEITTDGSLRFPKVINFVDRDSYE